MFLKVNQRYQNQDFTMDLKSTTVHGLLNFYRVIFFNFSTISVEISFHENPLKMWLHYSAGNVATQVAVLIFKLLLVLSLCIAYPNRPDSHLPRARSGQRSLLSWLAEDGASPIATFPLSSKWLPSVPLPHF